MTATSTVMPTMAYRRHELSVCRVMMPAICRKISRIGNSKPMPNASIMYVINVKYLPGAKAVTKLSVPPIDTRKSSARGSV